MGLESRVGYAQNAFLGEGVRNADFVNKVDGVAEGINKILNPIDDIAKGKVVGDSIKLIRGLGIQVDQVSSLKETLQDPNKSEVQRENAEGVLDILAKGTYIAMRYGGNKEIEADLCSGSVEKIEARLPEPLKGLGERVRANIIDEPQIIEVLDALDKQRERHEKNGVLGRKTLSKKIEEAYEKLDTLKIESEYEDQRGMVMAFLGVEAEELGLVAQGGSQKVDDKILEELKKTRELREREITDSENEKERFKQQRLDQEERLIETGREDFFEAMLIHEAPQQVDPFSQMAPEWMKNYPDKALLQKIIALHNSAYMKMKYGNQFLDELVDPKGQGVYSASNEVMRKMYEEIPGVRETKEYLIKSLFEEAEENGVFVLRLNGWGAVQKEKKKAGGMEMVKYIDKGGKERESEKYKQSLAYKDYREKIINTYGNIRKFQDQRINDMIGEIDGVDSKADALQAMSIAWCQLFVGNTWESADIDKDIPPCEAVMAQAWNFCHPDNKARNKLLGKEQEIAGREGVGTEEGWGGQKGQWLARRIEKSRAGSKDDQKFVRDYINGAIHPFPDRLFCSFTEQYDVESPEGKMSEAEALMKGIEIDYSKMAISADPWGSYYDMADSANKLYQVTTGKTPLPLDNRSWDEALKWVSVVADARNKLRTNRLLQPYVDNPEFVLWSIVGGIKGGVFMESPELVMMTPDVGMVSQQRNLEAILRTRDLVDDEGRKYIMEKLNCRGFASEQRRMMILNSLVRTMRGKK